MRLWKQALLSLCLGLSAAGQVKPPAPKWQIDLGKKYQLQAFDRDVNFRWVLHQDVLFLSADKVLVYQVNRSRAPVKLAPRDASGGGGNFILEIKIFSTQDGHEIKTLQLPTNAEASSVMATRNGRFIVRTGDILYLYSADFEKLAEKPLPMKRQVREEDWQIGVSPSGEEVVLVHQQVFKRNQLSPTSDIERASADVEVLNEENLKAKANFSLPWFIAAWSGGEHELVSSKPSPVAETATYGLLDFTGHWSPLTPDWLSPRQPCAYEAAALQNGLFIAYGCGNLSVFPRDGKRLFYLKSRAKEFFASVKSDGAYIAVQMESRFVKINDAANIPVTIAKPLRVELYSLKEPKPMISVPVRHSRIYYALSPGGTLAVVDGTALEFFEAVQ